MQFQPVYDDGELFLPKIELNMTSNQSIGTLGLILGLVLNISFSIITSFVQACLIAEEKERNTLRSLMMTPATTMDVLVGKSTLVFVMSSVVLAIATYTMGYEPASIWAFAAAIIFSIILYTAAGTICGLFSKTLLEASLSILPVAFVFTAALVLYQRRLKDE